MNNNIDGIVQNKVITALLQAYLDILDYDGMKSILKEAGMLRLKDRRDTNPDEYIELTPFKKILSAQDVLLFNSFQLLFTIGKKFSFYLFPFGKNFKESVEELTDLIQANWDVQIVKKTDKEINLKVDNCIFCSDIDHSCGLFIGFLVHALEKTLTTEEKVDYETLNEESSKSNSFILKLKIHKNNKVE
jgi:predicted hydrocarbon binding protein